MTNGDILTRGVTVPRLDALAFRDCTKRDATAPLVSLLSAAKQKLSTLRSSGLKFTLKVNEPAKLEVTLLGRLTKNGARGKSRVLAKATVSSSSAGQFTVTLRPNAAMRKRLQSEKRLPGTLQVKATDAARNVTTRTKTLTFR